MSRWYLAGAFHFLIIDFFFQFDHFTKIIFVGYLVAVGIAADLALVHDDPFLLAVINIDRLHQSVALAGPVAGIDILMFGPQAFGAMIGIACPLYRRAAVLTGEIFYIFYEFWHKIILADNLLYWF